MKCNPSCGNSLSLVSKILVIVGAINWGLYGIGMIVGTNLNLVNIIFGTMPIVESVVYILVAIAGVIMIFGCKCSSCGTDCADCPDCKVSEAPSESSTPNQ